jgi:hypothetical protein
MIEPGSLESGSSPTAASRGGVDSTALVEVTRSVDRHEPGKLDACSIDAALDRSDRAPADLRCLLVGKSRGDDKNESLALPRRQQDQSLAELVGCGRCSGRLRWCRGRNLIVYGSANCPLRVRSRVELIAQDHEQPCANIRAGVQEMYARNGALQGFVHQVIGLIFVPAQQDSEGAKPRYCGQHGVSMNSRSEKLLRRNRACPINAPRTFMAVAARHSGHVCFVSRAARAALVGSCRICHQIAR